MIATLPKIQIMFLLKVPFWLRKLITVSKIIVRHAIRKYKRNASFRQSWANLSNPMSIEYSE